MRNMQKANKKLTFRILINILKDTVRGFSEDNVTRLSASLAYATLFSIIPFLSFLIIIGTFFHVDLGNQLYTQLQPILGAEVVEQLKGIMENAEKTSSSTFTAIVSLGVTIFGATAIFAEIQGSLNTVWGIKPVPKKGWLKYIKNRLLSFSIILVFAFILLMTFVITNVIRHLSNRLMFNYPDVATSFIKIIGIILNIGVTTFIFMLIFKMLPDAKIRYRDVFVGAMITTILFLIGQWAISFYIGMANIKSVYGVAAFIIIILTWIYYSAIIIYIGAEFTQAWANKMGGKIFPDKYAVATKVVEIHENNPEELSGTIETEKKI